MGESVFLTVIRHGRLSRYQGIDPQPRIFLKLRLDSIGHYRKRQIIIEDMKSDELLKWRRGVMAPEYDQNAWYEILNK